jgi:uncharacterized membrane protein (UPF0127 family)
MCKPFLLTLTFLALFGAATPARVFAQTLPAQHAGSKDAATACSNPRLPPSILKGSAPFQVGGSLETISVAAPAHKLTLAVASNESDRELGLMCVNALAQHHGMIFVFSMPSLYGFWMKLTLIPLDMIWVGADGAVAKVAANVPASTLDTRDNAVARRYGQGLYVIELNAGEAALDGIRVGVKLTLPHLHGAN